MDEEESNSKVVWNFDDAESKLIFDMKLQFIKYRDSWDLEKAFWSLLSLLSEIENLFEESTKEELKKEFDEIISIRKESDNFTRLDEVTKGTCFIVLNEFYRKLCYEAVDKDYYFRKKKEYLGL